jgi:hypothetical protein
MSTKAVNFAFTVAIMPLRAGNKAVKATKSCKNFYSRKIRKMTIVVVKSIDFTVFYQKTQISQIARHWNLYYTIKVISN